MASLEDDIEDDVEDELEESGDEDPASKRKRAKALSDDDEEEDDNEEDESRGRGASDAPAKRFKRNRFVDDMADVQDDDEEDDEEYDDAPGEKFIDETEDVADGPAVDYMEFSRQQRAELDEDPDKLEEYYRERARQPYLADGGEDEMVGQHTLLPSLTVDPKLWLVKCLSGSERQCVTQLMQKFIHHKMKQPLAIVSAFCLDTLSGHFYIEAFKESSVRDACSGLRVVIKSKAPVLVPHAEMTDAITVKSTAKADITIGSWVRMQTGIYKGDLAQLHDFDSAGTAFVIKVVPRIDYGELLKKQQDKEQGIKALPFGGRRGKNQVRPPAVPFNRQEAEANQQVVEERYGQGSQMIYILNGSRQFKDGYELRRANAKSVKPDTSPPFEEVQRFMNAAVGGGSGEEAALLAAGSKKPAAFSNGDKVVVTKGDLKNMKGTVVEVDDQSTVWIKADVVGFDEKIDFPAADLQKFISVGTHVKVVAGPHHVGDLGMVTHTEGPTAMVLLDSTEKSIKVLVNNLTESLDTNSGLEQFGQYALHQAVLLTDNTVGMIVNISVEAATVLCNSGAEKAPVRQVRMQDIRKGLETKRIPARDCNDSRVSVGSMVELVDGPYRGKVGTVKHVYKMHVWLSCRDVTANAGFIVVFANQTRLRGSGKGAPGAQGTTINPRTPSRLNPQSPAYGAIRSPAHGLGGFSGAQPMHSPRRDSGFDGGRGGGGAGGGFSGRDRPGRIDDSLVNKRVKITKGGYRGYRGLVQHATATHVRMELDATNKVVTLDRSFVREDNPALRAPSQQHPAYRSGPGVHLPPPTPSRGLLGSRTPAYTPNFGSETPHVGGSAGVDNSYQGSHAYTPMTPGTALAPTMTPGGATHEMDHSYAAGTPYQASAATPGTVGGAGTAMTPGFGMTPGATMGMTPGTMGMTPGTMGMTPGGGDAPWSPEANGGADDEASVLQHYVRLQVILPEGGHGMVESCDSEQREACVIRGEIDGGQLQLTDERVTIAIEDLKLAAPHKDDRVRVIGGDPQHIGQAGTLIGIDNDDGIVKMEGDASDPLLILLLESLGRLVPEA